jgi:thiol-disulfide isomerase/thioredoxin
LRDRRRRGAAWLPAAVAALAIVLGPVPAVRAEAGPASQRDLTAIDPVSGERVPLLERGALFHIVLFATWCPPCVDELPYLADLEARWGEDGYVLVLVAVPQRQDRERLRAFLEQRRVPGRLVYDLRGDVLRDLGVDEIPTHVLLDGDGVELVRGVALADGIAERVEREMRGMR